MRNLYLNTNELDKRCSDEFGLSEAILMENAASAIELEVRKLTKGVRVLAVCGSGNNGADAICALRKLAGDYECYALLVSKTQGVMSKYQLSVAKKVGVNLIEDFDGDLDKLGEFECIIDGIFGSGLKRQMSDEICALIDMLNAKNALKIAVDIPSGINQFGQINQNAFKADTTLTMGGLKLGLFLDEAKDFVGKIKVANLGVSRDKFERGSDVKLLEKSDLKLPFRNKANTNKGEFGHTFVMVGDMSGAAQIAGLSASAIGSGLVSLVSDKEIANLSPILMYKSSLNSAKVVIAGCGLGDKKLNLDELTDKICVIDADLCYKKEVIKLLANNENLVITPHPKEFASLLNLTNIENVSVSDVQKNRFELAKIWSQKFKNVLVLKGANTIIAQNGKLYVMSEGSPTLAKGGSGDVLAGVIAGLLAQGYSPLEAAISGTLAHGFAGAKFSKNSYALTPFDLIEEIKCL
ncbi:NAD(P)H-hydrate dehydratase [Campylobacter geochelonis]|uniref:NAD(P)H-hydrate epimerase n=1 Tax=Campylobacter geochelonis TaxID=1780362 RepID=A0A128EB06_9BACT|nr:NAD(P)H-hydrate dehydratase [Campylobacter geochelonis]QKF70519.1 carbohydrate kinase, YjeF-related protein [Campylobacter geochelonis]CZE46119.1 YjeF-related protein [Campylobacter geochelonis]